MNDGSEERVFEFGRERSDGHTASKRVRVAEGDGCIRIGRCAGDVEEQAWKADGRMGCREAQSGCGIGEVGVRTEYVHHVGG